jgi:hypothetical protein
MSGQQMRPAPAESAANGPRRIGPRQVWETLSPAQQQQVLCRLVVMCQECLLPPPACRQPSQAQCDEEASHDAGRG